MRRVDYLFLAMIAFAAAVASAPPPPRIPIVGAWAVNEGDRLAMTQLDPSEHLSAP